MDQSDALCLTDAQEAHRIQVHKRHILQVQYDPWSIAAHLCLQSPKVCRFNSATQAENCVLAVGDFFDS